MARKWRGKKEEIFLERGDNARYIMLILGTN